MKRSSASFILYFIFTLALCAQGNDTIVSQSLIYFETEEQLIHFINDSSNESKIISIELEGESINLQSGYKMDSLLLLKFDQKLARLKNLVSLHISNCSLTAVPRSILQLKKLKSLSLGANEIEELPDLFQQLPGLTDLDIDYNKISSIDSLFSGNISESKIESISLQGNRIKSIPAQVNTLQHLEILILSYNRIEVIPILNCKTPYMTFDLSFNSITEFPEYYCREYTCEFEFNLGGNKIQNIPDCLLKLQKTNKGGLDCFINKQ